MEKKVTPNEKGSSGGCNKPLWAGVKLKKTPFSTKFLSAENLLEDSDDSQPPHQEDGTAQDSSSSQDYDDGQNDYRTSDPTTDTPGGRPQPGSPPLTPPGRHSPGGGTSPSGQAFRGLVPAVVVLHPTGKEPGNDSESRFPKKQELLGEEEAVPKPWNGTSCKQKSNKCHQVSVDQGTTLTQVASAALNDSEGYSSMESGLSPQHPEERPDPGCLHCGRSQQGDWTCQTSSVDDQQTGASEPDCVNACSFVTMPKVDKVTQLGPDEMQSDEDNVCQGNPVTVRVVKVSPGRSAKVDKETQLGRHELPLAEEGQNPEPPGDGSTSPAGKGHGLDGGRCPWREEVLPVAPDRPRRRQSLLEKRQKLIDLLTSKGTKRGPQVKTIKKTIRRILRGSELKDQEEKEEIVEEITEEVIGFDADIISKEPTWENVKHLSRLKGVSSPRAQPQGGGSLTRSVQQGKDGRHFLTTTFVQDQLDAGCRKLLNAAPAMH